MTRSFDFFDILQNRTARHLAFWILWVFSFTFVQSYGESMYHYFAWFSYYMVTLPVFVVHTYLVVYWLLPVFARKGRYLILILLFLVLLILFSIAELIISNEFIFKWFPTGTELIDNYLSPGHVLVSGLGNLYIVLVFLAVRTIREAYLARERREKYNLNLLEEKFDRVNNSFQPGLLLFSMDRLHELAGSDLHDAPAAIAAVSDLMNELLLISGLTLHPAEDEIRLVRKLIRLCDHFHFRVKEIAVSSSADLTRVMLKPLVIFTILEEVIRGCYGKEAPAFNLDFSQTGGGILEIRIECSGSKCLSGMKSRQEGLFHRIRLLYSAAYSFDFRINPENYTVIISQANVEE